MNESRYAHARLGQATALLEQVLSQPQFPADAIMERFFRANHKMGSKDRGFAAETVYGCLRHRRELAALAVPIAGDAADSEVWLAATWLLKHAGWSARVLAQAGFEGDAVALVERVRALDMFEFPFAVRANLPDWLADRLVAQFGESETLELAEALNQPAPVDIRVNTLKTDRDSLRQTLAQAEYETAPTPYSPIGLRRDKRGPLFNTPAFRDGLFELQDEGSQLIGLLLDAQPKQKVVDFCAGAGGKTLQLAAMMRNSGVLYACDVSEARLNRLKPRLRRAGVDTVQRRVLHDEHDTRLKNWWGEMDAVLVDAPCSGTGTLRRNPDIKWKSCDLAALCALQASILSAASQLVRPGGRLVYATCSLLDAENRETVVQFLSQHPDFTLTHPESLLAARSISLPGAVTSEGALQLLPHRHGTDGFFAAVLMRAGG
ncbi:MAG TPA: RsmB/NOP family class I SAM-dependent RNA methyltransferase [Gammaproteobacteria bacterium]|nr:RsmB/NOP family class I SAM-dependent RNA methyltransferase [Gammaproteobacteria bacterium]